jgi:hypothetical protein
MAGTAAFSYPATVRAAKRRARIVARPAPKERTAPVHTPHRLRWLLPPLTATGLTLIALVAASGHAEPRATAVPPPPHVSAIAFTGDPRPTLHPQPPVTTAPPTRTPHAVRPAPRTPAPAAARATVEHTAAPAAGRSTNRRNLAPPTSARQYARSLLSAIQYGCFSHIVARESGWSITATNPSSGAYGLMQALPGSKMASAGPDWRTNAATQIRWGIHYVKAQYGSACGAWDFWQSHGWY